MEESIKAQVIALAQTDPFLTVKDLAQGVGTTTRYVRTILSEADLSLHEMRKAYARRLERSREHIESSQMPEVHTELTLKKVAGRKVASIVPSWAELELFQASTIQGSSPLSYVQLITPEHLTLSVDRGPLRQLLPASCLEQLEVKGQKAEIHPAPEKLSTALGLPKAAHVLKLTTFLVVQETPVALEIRWLGLEGLVLEWSRLKSELDVRVGS